jgi:hypothetical protein
MSMNFRFSRDYRECQAVQPIRVCCYSNTNSAHVVVEQQCAVAQSMGSHADDTGGL